MTGFSTLPPLDGSFVGVGPSVWSDTTRREEVRTGRGGTASRDRQRRAAAAGRAGNRQPGRRRPPHGGAVRRVGLVRSLVDAGVPLERPGRGHSERHVLARLPRRARLRTLLGAQRRHLRPVCRASRGAGRPADADPRGRRLARAASRRPDPGRGAALRRIHRSPGEGGVPPSRHRATAARPGRRPAPHGRDGIGLLGVRGDQAGHGGGQAARRDPRDGVRRSDERPERAGHHGDVPPSAGAGLDGRHHRGARDGCSQPRDCTAGSSIPRPCASSTSPATPG